MEKRSILVGVGLVALLALTSFIISRTSGAQDSNGFEIRFQKTRTLKGGSPQVESEYMVIVRSDGQYKRTGTVGTVEDKVGKLDQMRQQFASRKWHLNHEEFINEDVILGYNVYVHGTHEGVTIRKAYAVELPMVPLRVVVTTDYETVTDEAVSITARPVTEKEVGLSP